MKTIKITAHNKISIIDVDFGDYKAMQKAVGGYVETVATEQMYDFFKRPVIMLVVDDIKAAQDTADKAGESAEQAKEAITITNQKVANIETGLDGVRLNLSETTTDLRGILDKTFLFNVQHHDNGDETSTASASLYKSSKDVTKEYPAIWYSWRKKTESGQEFLGYGYQITVNNEDYEFGGTIVGRFTTYKQIALVLNSKALILGKKVICFNAEE